jgi:hypothetical protein
MFNFSLTTQPVHVEQQMSSQVIAGSNNSVLVWWGCSGRQRPQHFGMAPRPVHPRSAGLGVQRWTFFVECCCPPQSSTACGVNAKRRSVHPRSRGTLRTPPPTIFVIFHFHPFDAMAFANKSAKIILVSPRHRALFPPVLDWRL